MNCTTYRKLMQLAVGTVLLTLAPAGFGSVKNDPNRNTFFDAAKRALETKRLVFLPDPHGDEKLADALARLYSNLAVTAGGVSLFAEFMNPFYQDIMDRYLLALEDIPISTLSNAWFDASDIGTWRRDAPDVLRVIAAIRARNETLPKAQRIRILGGSSPIDWSRVQSPADLAKAPPKNRYVMQAIDHMLENCPQEKIIVQYGPLHTGKRFWAHYAKPNSPAFFYLGFLDIKGRCAQPVMTTFVNAVAANKCLGTDPNFVKPEMIAEAYAKGLGVAYRIVLSADEEPGETKVTPDKELERRLAIIAGVSGEEFERLHKQHAQPLVMPACRPK